MGERAHLEHSDDLKVGAAEVLLKHLSVEVSIIRDNVPHRRDARVPHGGPHWAIAGLTDFSVARWTLPHSMKATQTAEVRVMQLRDWEITHWGGTR